MVNESHPLIFMHIPKTGGMSMFAGLCREYGTNMADMYNMTSADVAPAPYPRMTVVTGHLSAIATVAPAQWTRWIAWNNDGNGTTFPSANTGQQMRGGPVVANTWGFSAHTTHIFLAANTPLQIAIRVGRDFDVGGTNDLGGTRCILNAVLYNQNGSASPFDVAGDTGPSAVRD